MIWRALAAATLLAAAAVRGWVLWGQRSQDDALAPAGRADYVLKDFELIALDAQGNEAFTLSAPRLARDPHAKTLDIATPLFVIPPSAGSQGAPWEIRSSTGWVSAEGDELRLRGKVRATSNNVDNQPIAMTTEQLNVFPDTRRATSAVAVTLVQPGLTMRGRGLEANLATRQVALKSDIKGRYESIAR